MMSKAFGHLMERNLREVFGQRDSVRRKIAISELYTEDCSFFEAEEQIVGRDALSAKGRPYSSGGSRIRLSVGRFPTGKSRSRPLEPLLLSQGWVSRSSIKEKSVPFIRFWTMLRATKAKIQRIKWRANSRAGRYTRNM